MRTSLSRIVPPAAHVIDPAPDLNSAHLPALDRRVSPAPGYGLHTFVDPISVTQDDPAQTVEADADCDIGAAVAIVMGRFPVTYTKAFAIMLAYCDRTQRSMPELAAAVLKTYSPQPSDTSPRDGVFVPLAIRTPAAMTARR
jgi:hypothetical protein